MITSQGQLGKPPAAAVCACWLGRARPRRCLAGTTRFIASRSLMTSIVFGPISAARVRHYIGAVAMGVGLLLTTLAFMEGHWQGL